MDAALAAEGHLAHAAPAIDADRQAVFADTTPNRPGLGRANPALARSLAGAMRAKDVKHAHRLPRLAGVVPAAPDIFEVPVGAAASGREGRTGKAEADLPVDWPHQTGERSPEEAPSPA